VEENSNFFLPLAPLALQLDITNRGIAHTAVNRVYETFGRIDVVVKNTGYGQEAKT
jgi:NADP-dependent 3-hydroxy acid dehydrogenase YdfG